jgi:hypothetical protein
VSGRLRSRLDRLERAVGAPAATGPEAAVAFVDAAGVVRRLLVTGRADGWKWRDVPPDTPLPETVWVKYYGWPEMSELWDEI